MEQLSKVVVLLIVVGCTSSPGSLGTTSDGGSALDATAVTGDASAAGCVALPVEGAACTAGATVCGKSDKCCVGQWACVSGKWALSLLECAPQAPSCGKATCGCSQYCETATGGAAMLDDAGNLVGSTSYMCRDYPPACAFDWSCACLAKADAGLAHTACDDSDGGTFPRTTVALP